MDLTEEQRMIRETVREFVDSEVRDRVAEADETQKFPEGVWDELATLDFTGLTVPAEYGEFDVERYYRDAKITTIYEGTTNIQKDIIARHLRE